MRDDILKMSSLFPNLILAYFRFRILLDHFRFRIPLYFYLLKILVILLLISLKFYNLI